MSEYLIKVGFWLHAYDSVTIEAEDDEQAISKGKACATTLMQSRAFPETIDTDERRRGIIAYIDRVAPGRRHCVVEDITFDSDRILDPDGPQSDPSA
jgi:hypothetical protein